MNPELKAKWIAALRSGDYKQGRGVLRSPDESFCCLGVLCDISGMGQWIRRSYYADGTDGYACLPAAVSRVAALSISEGRLAKMNDHGKSFADIADYIEANL